MATTNDPYTPVATKKTTFRIVRNDSNGGDPDTWNNGYKDLADHVGYLQGLISPDTAINALTMYAHTATLITNWSYNATPSTVSQSSVAAAGTVVVPLELGFPLGKVLHVTSYGCSLIGAAGHGALPATMPTLKLRYRTVTALTGSITTVSTVTDTSGSTAAYQSSHQLIDTSTDYALAGSTIKALWLELTGEASTNSITGLQAGNFFITYYWA